MLRLRPPVQTAGRLELAGFWIRFGAYLIDGLILGIPLFVVEFVLFPDVGDRVWFSLSDVIASAMFFLYNWLMLAENQGRTLGKQAVGIRITRPDGMPVDHGISAARAAMSLVSSLPFALAYLWAAWDEENRTWHDMVADTRAFVQHR